MAELYQKQGDHTREGMYSDFAIRPVEGRVHFHKVIGFRNPESMLNNVPIPVELHDLLGRKSFSVRKENGLAKALDGFLNSRMVFSDTGLEVFL